MAVRLFVSYSHKDKALCEKLSTHLSNLRNQGIIQTWYDGDILPGTAWEEQIITQLATADIILLLISADFLASSFCFDREMQQALARHEAGQARVLPVILRPVDWSGAPFAKLQVLPSEAKAVTLWGSLDLAFADVVKGIRRAIDDLLTMREASANKSAEPAKNAAVAPQRAQQVPEVSRIQQNSRWTEEQLKKLQARSSAITRGLQDLQESKTRGRIDEGRYLALKADLDQEYTTLLGQVREKLADLDQELDAIMLEAALLRDAGLEDPAREQRLLARLAQVAQRRGLARPLVEMLSRQQGSLVFWLIEVGIQLVRLPG